MPDASDYISRKNSDALVAGAAFSNKNRSMQGNIRAFLKRSTGPRGYRSTSVSSNTRICFGLYNPAIVKGCLPLAGYTGELKTDGTFTFSDGSIDTTVLAGSVFPVSTNEISSMSDPVIIYNCTDKTYRGTSLAQCSITINPYQFYILIFDKVTLSQAQFNANPCVTRYTFGTSTTITSVFTNSKLNSDLSFVCDVNGATLNIPSPNVFPASTDQISINGDGIIYNCTGDTYMGTTNSGDSITIGPGQFYTLSFDAVTLTIQV